MKEILEKISNRPLLYSPTRETILSDMRKRRDELLTECYDGVPQTLQTIIKHTYEVAWREACLHCLQQIRDVHDVAKGEAVNWKEPAQSYLERVYEEIMKDNALSPFVNYQERSQS